MKIVSRILLLVTVAVLSVATAYATPLGPGESLTFSFPFEFRYYKNAAINLDSSFLTDGSTRLSLSLTAALDANYPELQYGLPYSHSFDWDSDSAAEVFTSGWPVTFDSTPDGDYFGLPQVIVYNDPLTGGDTSLDLLNLSMRLRYIDDNGVSVDTDQVFVLRDGDPVTPSPVPEPGTFILLVPGLAGLAISRRWKRGAS